MAFDVRKLIQDLGGVTAVHKLMGGAVTLKAVEKWRERNKMPLRRFAELNAALVAAGRAPLSATAYLTTNQETTADDHGKRRRRAA